MNITIISGRWTKDVEMKYTSGSNPTAVVSGSLAVERDFKKEGQPDADFPRVVVYGKQAEALAEHCGKKGDGVYIEGMVRTRSWKDENTGKNRSITEIVAKPGGVEFGRKAKRNNSNGNGNGNSGNGNGGFGGTTTEDEVPF